MRTQTNAILTPQYTSLENLFRDCSKQNAPLIIDSQRSKSSSSVHSFIFSEIDFSTTLKELFYTTRRSFFRHLRSAGFIKSKIFSHFPTFNKQNSFFTQHPIKSKRQKVRSFQPIYLSNTKKADLVRFNSNWTSGVNESSEYNRLKNRLSFLVGTPVSVTFIPALSFVRYAFDIEAANSTKLLSDSGVLNSARFLRNVENELSGRFQYVASNIPDLARFSFICIYFKKPSALSKIFAIGLSSLPRNRKETQFLRFLIKLIKVFSSQRRERLGVRIRFKGRVNRWRRTKYVNGDKGKLPFYTYSSRIEIGESQAITRKGTLGIRIWIAYHPSFAYSFRRSMSFFIYKTN